MTESNDDERLMSDEELSEASSSSSVSGGRDLNELVGELTLLFVFIVEVSAGLSVANECVTA